MDALPLGLSASLLMKTVRALKKKPLSAQRSTHMKIVINSCYGGFGLSTNALRLYAKRKGKKIWVVENKYEHEQVITVPPEQLCKSSDDLDWCSMTPPEKEAHNNLWKEQHVTDSSIARDDPDLVYVVEKLKHNADGRCAELRVVEIPDAVKWYIVEYDGNEHIAEEHRTWR
jgi:hypothetical protein